MTASHQPWYFYMAFCSDGSLYCGIAKNVEQRIAEHNSGKGAKYTRARRPIELVYREKCDNELFARRREREVKAWRREKKLKLLNGFPSA